MNKKGNVTMILIVVALVLVLGGVAWMVATSGTPQQVIITEDTDVASPVTCADSTGKLTVSSLSKLPGATAPSSPTITCGVDDGAVVTSVTSGTTTFPIGTDLECLISKSDFIDKSFKFNMPCGGKNLEAPLYYSTSDNPAIRLINDEGDYLSDAVTNGAVNQTNLSLGESLTITVEFTGSSTEGTGEGVYVVETPASSSDDVSKIEMGDLKSVPVPSTHTLQNAASRSAAFVIPNIENGVRVSYPITFTVVTGKHLGGGILTDWYGGQEFIDDDNTISSGVEDYDGTAKYENTFDSDFQAIT